LRGWKLLKENAVKHGYLYLGILLLVLAIAWVAHPVCVPIPPETLSQFTPYPIEQRQDRDLFYFRTFQQRDGQWCQCKSWISRQFFF
jgi:hypothetical protein